MGERGEGFTFTRRELTQLFTFVEETLVAFDEGGQITFASPSLRELIGLDPEQVIGTPVLSHLHPDDVEGALAKIKRWTGRHGATHSEPVRVRHQSGDWIPVGLEALSGDLVSPLGTIVLTLRPLTERTEVETKLRQRLVNEDRLTRLARAFLGLPPDRFDEGVRATLAEMGSLEGVDRISIWLASEGEQHMSHEWTAPDIEPGIADAPALPMSGLPFIDALARLEEVNIGSVAELPQSRSQEKELWATRGVLSLLAVPMIQRGNYVGFMSFGAIREVFTFESQHVSTLRTAAGILAQAFARQEAEQRLAHQARFDSLTGLGNRWTFLEETRRALQAPGSDRSKVAVLLLDLDRFKVVNDSLGHTAGDELLGAVASRLASSLAPYVVARLGGDELVVLVDDLESPEEAVDLARRELSALRNPFVVAQHEVFMTASIGIAYAVDGDQEVDEPDELLRQADAAMYAAKERGRNRIEVFDDDLRERVNRRLQDESDLRRALTNGELTVHYQPEIELDTGQVVATEALVRWEHPVRGLLSAAQFIDVAEETAAILDIGPWVLLQACRQLRHWDEVHTGQPLTMRVNLSARQVAQPDLVPRVVEVIEQSGIDPARLCLEITETTLMADPEVSLEVLRALRALGVELAVDDFGTGYSSLAYLKRFPVNVLKIDRSFIDGLGEDPDDTAIVSAIISLAEALKLQVTAEGVETERQLEELRRLGCRRVQGYLLAMPESPSRVLARL